MPKSKNKILDDDKIQKAYKNPKLSAKFFFVSDLVIKQVNLLVFMTMLWLLSENWCFQKKFSSELTLRWSDTPDVFSTFWDHSEFIGTHWHIATSLVHHTGFNGGLVGFGVLSKVCLFERPRFFCFTLYLVNFVLYSFELNWPNTCCNTHLNFLFFIHIFHILFFFTYLSFCHFKDFLRTFSGFS